MLTATYLTQLMACSLALLLIFLVAPCTGQNSTATISTTTATNTTNTATSSNGTQSTNGSQISTSPAATNQTAGKYHFDCKRKGETCAPGVTCDLASGKCLCTSTPSDFMCYPITPASNCASPCQNGGICASTVQGPVCSCTDSYYGAECELDIVQVLCDVDKMYININPTENFAGIIYVQNYPSCNFSFLGNADAKAKISQYSDYQKNPNAFVDFEGYGREIPNSDSTCGSASVENGVNTRRILIQYDLLFKTSVDQVVVARCSSNAQKMTIYLDPVTVNDYNSNLGQIETEGKGGIVKLNLMKSDGSPATAVNLGDPVSLVFRMAAGGTGANSDFRIQKCTANNTKTGADLKEVTFIQNGCPTDIGKSIITGPPTRATNAGSISVTINLKAFLFLGSSNVAFFCSIEFCTACATPSCSSSSGVNPPATSNSSSGNNVNPPANTPVNGSNPSNTNPAVNSSNTIPGNSSNPQNPALANGSNPSPTDRKRRDAPTQNDVGAMLTVNDPDNTSEQQNTPAPPTTKEPPTTEDCINNPKITAVVAILAACVGLLLIVSAFLSFLLIASKRKAAPSSHYSSPVETVRIPRLEMYNTHQAGI